VGLKPKTSALHGGTKDESKKTSTQNDLFEKTEPRVKEEGVRYGRHVSHKAGPSLGLSLAQAKKRLSKPVKRSAKEIRWALGIAGIGEGPKDLSENMRAYLRREK
jgi:hypothetical protein